MESDYLGFRVKDFIERNTVVGIMIDVSSEEHFCSG